MIRALLCLAMLAAPAQAAQRYAAPRQHWTLIPIQRVIGARPACRGMACLENGARYR